jgi:hypothetical protein
MEILMLVYFLFVNQNIVLESYMGELYAFVLFLYSILCFTLYFTLLYLLVCP